MTSDITLGRQYFCESVESFEAWQPWRKAIKDYQTAAQETQIFIDQIYRGDKCQYDSTAHKFIEGVNENPIQAAKLAAKEHAHYLLQELVLAAMPVSEAAKQPQVVAFLEKKLGDKTSDHSPVPKLSSFKLISLFCKVTR